MLHSDTRVKAINLYITKITLTKVLKFLELSKHYENIAFHKCDFKSPNLRIYCELNNTHKIETNFIIETFLLCLFGRSQKQQLQEMALPNQSTLDLRSSNWVKRVLA